MKKICSLDGDKLKKILLKFLYSQGYKKIKHNDNYIVAEGDIPICLVAHMDTVFKRLPADPDEWFFDKEKNMLWYPGGAGFDDRAGIYAIIQILKDKYKPHIIFTNGEEIGGVGATALVKKYKKIPFPSCKALIELDRANYEDMVFYNCDNPDFEKYIERFGFKLEYGTFSDISILAPAWGIPAVNLSIGYLDEHTMAERLLCSWCDNTIVKVETLLSAGDDMPNFEYIPATWPKNDNIASCLLCDKRAETLYVMKDTAYPYYLCEDCLKKYYDKNFLNFDF